MKSQLALALAATLLAGRVAAAPGITGLWKTPVDEGTVRIETCVEAICGRAIGSTQLTALPDQKDVRNRDASLRNRPLKGLLVLKLKPIGPNRWGDGWVYDPRSGATFKGSAELKSDGRLLLQGCIVAPLCQTQTWTKAN
jgi:uncharacterized protein (DUF2147 family)